MTENLSSTLINVYSTDPLGICGQRDPAGLFAGIPSEELRLNLITLGVVVVANPLQQEQWARLTGARDNWLFEPSKTAYQPSQAVTEALQQLQIGAPAYSGRVWWQVSRGVQGRFKGSWRSLLEANACDCAKLLAYLDQSQATFPVLSGPVISRRWLDLVHRIGGISLTGWEALKVLLPQSLAGPAAAFGIQEKEIHPQLYAALSAWSTGCRTLPPQNCGLASCPRRK